MKVYIAERGCYESSYVSGVFDSPGRAMAAMPGRKWTRTTWAGYPHEAGNTYDTWDNNLDWDESVRITEHEVVVGGPIRDVDKWVVQKYRESDGHWDYIPQPLSAVESQ